jgi:hypothetical protein
MPTTDGQFDIPSPKNKMSNRPPLRISLYALLLSSALWLSGAATASVYETGAEAQTTAKTNKNIDACSLLTGGEIATVLGEPLQELKPGAQASGNMKVSHCLFVTRDFARSASLAVTTPAATPAADDTGGRSLRAFWRHQFHSPRKPEQEKRATAYRESDKESNSESDREADQAASKPRAIPALGEEAYWVGSPISGALYVLQGNLFLRISVGGIPNESSRIAKSKALAAAILSRLINNPR